MQGIDLDGQLEKVQAPRARRRLTRSWRCLTKLVHGAWLPLLIGVTAFTVLTTWQRGRRSFLVSVKPELFPLKRFHQSAFTVASLRGSRGRNATGQPQVTVDGGGRPRGQIDEQPGCGSSTARTASATWAGDKSTNTSTPRSNSSGRPGSFRALHSPLRRAAPRRVPARCGKDKQLIRERFHPQLAELWTHEPPI
jgi:potassium transporter